ncbi:MAG TPA: hypothetical protein VK716_05810 [Terracidiphilus sp.]|jgi:hypothetical protein|nr:hypothetical protein [Terracidiphilus sp.]
MITRKNNLICRSLSVATVLFLVATSATFAQALNSNTATVALNATLSESLTVAATPANVTFALVNGGTATGNAPVVMTTKWVLSGARTSVTLVGYFSSATAALTDGATTPTNIPTSEVFGQVTSGTPTSYTAFTQTAPLGTAGAGLSLFTQAISASNRASNRSDNLNLQINLTAQPQLPAGTYTGTLNLQAQAL